MLECCFCVSCWCGCAGVHQGYRCAIDMGALEALRRGRRRLTVKIMCVMMLWRLLLKMERVHVPWAWVRLGFRLGDWCCKSWQLAVSLSNGPHAFCSTVNCISTVEAHARSLLGCWWFCGAVVSMQAMAGDDGWQLRGDSGDLRGNMKCV